VPFVGSSFGENFFSLVNPLLKISLVAGVLGNKATNVKVRDLVVFVESF